VARPMGRRGGNGGKPSLIDLHRLSWLRQFLPLPNGIPSQECLGWIMERLSLRVFQEAFAASARSVARLTQGRSSPSMGRKPHTPQSRAVQLEHRAAIRQPVASQALGDQRQAQAH
jgi:hypothetical protein